MQTIELAALSKVLGGTAAAPASPDPGEAQAGAQVAAQGQAQPGQPSTQRVELPGGGWTQTTTWPGGQMFQLSTGNGMFSFSFSSSSSSTVGA